MLFWHWEKVSNISNIFLFLALFSSLKRRPQEIAIFYGLDQIGLKFCFEFLFEWVIADDAEVYCNPSSDSFCYFSSHLLELPEVWGIALSERRVQLKIVPCCCRCCLCQAVPGHLLALLPRMTERTSFSLSSFICSVCVLCSAVQTSAQTSCTISSKDECSSEAFCVRLSLVYSLTHLVEVRIAPVGGTLSPCIAAGWFVGTA